MHKPQTLKNGTRVHLVPMEGTEAMTILVLYGVGSRDESDAVWGGSHFIEHLMFKGTKRRPSTLELTKLVDRYGAEYNAYTGKDLTAYYIKIDGQQAAVAIDVLGDMLTSSLFAPKEMDRERKVIIEEIKMYEENPIMHVEELLEEALFPNHVLGRNIAGTAKTMTKMRRSDILAYRDGYYVPENTVIVVSGKIPANAMAQLEKAFGKQQGGTMKDRGPLFTPGKRGSAIPVRRQKKTLEQAQIAFGFPTIGRGHKDEDAIRLLSTILGGSMSSRLFIEVRERRGLAYTIRSSWDGFADVGYFQIRAGLDGSRLALACKVIMDECAKVVRRGVTAAELKQAKEHVRGAMTLHLEDSSERAEFFGRQELYFGRVRSVEERLKDIERVRLADVNRVARDILDPKRMAVGAVGPFAKDEDILQHVKAALKK